MGSRQTTNAFPEQSSSHESYNLNRVTETATSRRVRVTTRAQKKRQEPIEPMQDVYGLSLPSQSQNLIEPDPELQRMRRLRRTVPRAVTYKVPSSSEGDTDIESSSTRIRTSRQNKRTQERAELDEPESSTSYNNSSGPISRPNKRRAIRAEEGVSRSEQDAYPIIILPPPYRSDSPLPTILQTAESETIQDSSSYLQPFNLPTTGNNTGGVVTLPPISLPQENSAHGGITLPPIRSVLSLADRSRTPEIEVVDLSSPPSYPSNNAADPYPNNIVDLTSSPVIFSPNTHSTAVNSSYKNSNNNNHSPPEIIIIDDDSSAEDLTSATSPLPSKGLQLKCAICLDFPKDVSFTPCGHIFCRDCISTALKSQKVCSLCRRTLTKKQIKRLEFKILVK
ncbi:hypothetical protein RhiirA5_405373 [Rhizophagus irregularis]|uniref:RING-type domain-containing protein n=2 Tax=Rhizophagus irregularis TaxID=588596 RepID=A0A2N0QFR3_9GLOM|nr:E3 ubiquitin-protein ligase RAD18 [Rhizophagus irregularis DAOM 197198w]PKC17915.1 hypothetical protein RhiirA5_405373 [Rhizophagus irregularis]PKC74077.1 hypothetical protein RhiirA1_409678 [Rhizophagus irregularis]